MAKHNRYLVGLLALWAGLATTTTLAQDKAPTQEDRQALVELSKKVEKEVEALRGWKFKHEVKTDIRTKPELVEFIKGKVAEEYGPGRMSRKQAMLRMVGVIPPDCELVQTFLDVLASQVGGFYDPDKKTFYMMVREGMEATSAMGRVVIAHELTHALDDQYIDLNKLMENSTESEDRELAIGAVVEGSATFLMTRYIMTPPYNKNLSPEELAEAANAEMKHADTLIKAPRYFSVLLANYICGMNFMTRGNQALVMQDSAGKQMQRNLEMARKNPPRSSEQILHPEKYWGRPEEPVVIRDAVVEPILTEMGFKVVHRDTLGEILLGVLTSPADEPLNMMASQLPTYWTTEASTGWGGDRFFLLSKKAIDKDAAVEGELQGLWITAWDTENDREEFEEDYEFERDELPQERDDFQVGPRVRIYTYGIEEEQAEDLVKRLSQMPGMFTQNGKSWSSKS